VAAHAESADLLVAFEPGGVTGHPDHRAATATAARVAHRFGLPVLEWGVTAEVAASLRAELGVPFRSLEGERAAMVDIAVDRSRQLRAIACHHSQSADNPVLHRRLALQGPHERLRFVPPCCPPV
jgi:LmbE family N-acetylglucosaminyl deacetylase